MGKQCIQCPWREGARVWRSGDLDSATDHRCAV